MSLAALLKNAVDTVITALDDVPLTVTYNRSTNGAYNATTDSLTRIVTPYTIKVLKYKTDDMEMNHTDVVRKTTKVLVPGNAIPFVPDAGDYLIMEGNHYEIFDIKPVPSNAAYILRVRLP